MRTFPALDPAVPTRQVPGPIVTIGADPELFAVDKRGRVIGSERVLPAHSHIVGRDGVQFELHPESTSCRANVGNSLKEGIVAMNDYLQKVGKGEWKVSFKQLVSVSKMELLGLSEDSRKLGCAPSENIYGHKTPELDGLVYRKRTGAGHIHLGFDTKVYHKGKLDQTVKLLDIVVGIPSVLLDRNDAAAIERRKNYGKAGEYRLPHYGLEYRTPSNFWLRSYQLFSFVSAMSRTAVKLGCGPYFSKTRNYEGFDLHTQLTDKVSDDRLQEVINTNSYDGALELYETVLRPVLWQINSAEGVWRDNLVDFDFFLTKPIEKWFPTDPLTHWLNVPEGHGCGWETFLEKTVKPQRLAAERLLTGEKPVKRVKIRVGGAA